MEAWDVLPGLLQQHGRAASARMGTHDHHQPHYQGAQAKEGASRCQPTRQKEAGAPGAVREIAAGRAGPDAQRAIRGFYGAPGSAPGARTVERDERLAPRLPCHRGSRGSGFTPRAPRETAPSRARAPGGGRGSPPPLATRPGLRKKVAPRRARCGARRAPLPPLARPSAHRSAPQPRLLGRRLPSLGPGPGAPPRPPSLQGARRPRGQALSAPAAPSVPVGAAPRDAPLQLRAALLRAGPARAGGVWANRGEGGTGRGGRRGSAGGRRKPQRHQSPRRRGWGGGKRGPPPSTGPRSLARPAFPTPTSLSGEWQLASCAWPSLPPRPRLHGTQPCQAFWALTCSSRF